MKKLNMKAKLLIGQVPAMVLIIAIVGIIIYLNTSSAILGMQKEVLQDFTNNGSNLVDEFLTQYETKATITAQTKDIREAIVQRDSSICMDSLQIIYEANKNLKGQYLLENLFITDSEGVIIDDVLHGAIGIDLKTIPQFEPNVAQGKAGKVHISVISLSPVTGRPVILITAPVISDTGEFLGLVGVPHETAFMFTNYIEQNKIGSTGYSYICNSDGIVLAHPKEEMLGVNLKDDYEFGAGLFATKNDYYGYNWEGNDKTVYVQVNERSGWYVMTGINDSEFKDITKGTILTIIIGVISIAIVSILIIYIMSTVMYKGIKSNMNGFIESSGQLEQAALQFHESSQELSSGNQEQAASVEEISASISQTANMTAANTENTYEANKLSKNAQKSVSEANREMEVMQQTMEDIKRSSAEIGKILKVIEDIAFRTNMLALNAAVEAARAGDAGSGFAVVANEVKNLASKSQEAAQNSATMIENSITTANKGAEASNLVAQSLSSITEEIAKINVLMGEISVASEQQSQGIEQINVAISQVETVTQQNADNAVNVANSADSLNQQVNKINGYVGDLSRILDGEKANTNTEPDIEEIEASTTLMLEE